MPEMKITAIAQQAEGCAVTLAGTHAAGLALAPAFGAGVVVLSAVTGALQHLAIVADKYGLRPTNVNVAKATMSLLPGDFDDLVDSYEMWDEVVRGEELDGYVVLTVDLGGCTAQTFMPVARLRYGRRPDPDADLRPADAEAV